MAVENINPDNPPCDQPVEARAGRDPSAALSVSELPDSLVVGAVSCLTVCSLLFLVLLAERILINRDGGISITTVDG